MVDPQGYLFYSIGSTGINPGISFDRIKGREYIYKELPPVINGMGIRNIENLFYTWNLTRRYDHRPTYSELVNEAIKTHERILDIDSGQESPVNQQTIIR